MINYSDTIECSIDQLPFRLYTMMKFVPLFQNFDVSASLVLEKIISINKCNYIILTIYLRLSNEGINFHKSHEHSDLPWWYSELSSREHSLSRIRTSPMTTHTRNYPSFTRRKTITTIGCWIIHRAHWYLCINFQIIIRSFISFCKLLMLL